MNHPIFVSCLEYSANLHLASLIHALKKQNINFSLHGIFDDSIIQGYQSDFSPKAFRVMGFTHIQVIFDYFKIQKQLIKIASTCELALFMDSSSFNIPLLKKIKTTHPSIQTIYYILPQVWAWKAYRAKTLALYCDALWSILPFEQSFYPPNANICYVGHPLLDSIKANTKHIQTNKIAFLPGSRKSEIQTLLPLCIEIAAKLKAQGKTALLVIPKHFSPQEIKSLYPHCEDFIFCQDSHQALKQSEFAFICSGTATLEATLMGIPNILIYQARAFDYCLAKLLVKLNYIGLANIFLEFQAFGSPKNNPNPKHFPIHPEFIQKLDAHALLACMQEYDFAHFFAQHQKLLAYLNTGSAQSCAQKIAQHLRL